MREREREKHSEVVCAVFSRYRSFPWNFNSVNGTRANMNRIMQGRKTPVGW